jgi:predicted anti-sigma-YlaC factor YlaD
MTMHFDDQQLDAMLASSPDAEQTQHLADCAPCRARYEELAGEFAALRAIDTHLDSLPEHFWSRQRHAIHSAAAEYRPPRFAFGRYTWAGAAAAIVLFVAIMWPLLPTDPNISKPPVVMSDTELLQSVEDSAYSYPEAIHPAQVMYSEIESAQLVGDGRTSPSPKKGTTK